jgi:hypothetical protein
MYPITNSLAAGEMIASLISDRKNRNQSGNQQAAQIPRPTRPRVAEDEDPLSDEAYQVLYDAHDAQPIIISEEVGHDHMDNEHDESSERPMSFFGGDSLNPDVLYDALDAQRLIPFEQLGKSRLGGHQVPRALRPVSMMGDDDPLSDQAYQVLYEARDAQPIITSTTYFDFDKSPSINAQRSEENSESLQTPSPLPEPQTDTSSMLAPSPIVMPASSPEPCPGLDNTTLSLSSSVSSPPSISGRSVSASSRISDGAPGSGSGSGSSGSGASLSVRKRGYMRPQATIFSESATKRDSVMNLGSIAHLQYYFARTGLLDGKGAQLARKDSNLRLRKSGESLNDAFNNERSLSLGAQSSSALLSPSDMPNSPVSDITPSHQSFFGDALSEEPMNETTYVQNDRDWDSEMAMMPPTFSTYKFQRPAYVAPPPDLTMLRRELTEALEDALKVLKESNDIKPPTSSDPTTSVEEEEESTDGWYAIQGLHLLDITTLAIRAAKNYYISHSSYQRLHAIKPESEIRRDLHSVLEILQRMAARNFSGGLRQVEKVAILEWIVGISELIAMEIAAEKKEAEERERWAWRVDDKWVDESEEGTKKDMGRAREEAFVRCFVEDPASLPEWTDPEIAGATLPTEFLARFGTGLELVKLHNASVRASKRHFELIKTWHEDTTKPYRRAENLRFWAKAAELRWDKVQMPAGFNAQTVALLVDAPGTLSEQDRQTWITFDKAVLAWCKGVREELVEEWEKEKEKERMKSRNVTPKLTLNSEDGEFNAEPEAVRPKTPGGPAEPQFEGEDSEVIREYYDPNSNSFVGIPKTPPSQRKRNGTKGIHPDDVEAVEMTEETGVTTTTY